MVSALFSTKISSSIHLVSVIVCESKKSKTYEIHDYYSPKINKIFVHSVIYRDIYCYANWEVVNFEREFQSLPPGTKILVMPELSYISDQIVEKLNFQAKI